MCSCTYYFIAIGLLLFQNVHDLCDYRGEKEITPSWRYSKPLATSKATRTLIFQPSSPFLSPIQKRKKVILHCRNYELVHNNHTIIFSLQICEVIYQSEYWDYMMKTIIRLIDSDKKDSFQSITDTVGFTDQEGLAYCTSEKLGCLYSCRHTQAYVRLFQHSIQPNSQGFYDAAFPITSPE